MNRLLAPLILTLSFCCAPATQDVPPPANTPQSAPPHSAHDSAPEPRANGGSHYASPPANQPSELPSQQPDQQWRDAPAERPRAERKTAESSPQSAQSAPSAKGNDAYRAESEGAIGGATADRRSSPMPKAQLDDRPGLGTSWGESRTSQVNEVPFERDGSSPTFASSLQYNDQRGAQAMAQRDSDRLSPTSAAVNLGGALTVSLRNEWGSVLSAYRGGRNVIAVGDNGQRYCIVVQNHTNERFEVLLSVDGLDVLDGKDAGYGKRGYLIEAYATVEIEGFRQSEDAVAAFRFGSVRDSYAARTGSARNVGVIGAAAFGERGYLSRLRAYQDRIYTQRVPQQETERRRNADPFPNKWATAPLYQAR